MKNEKIMELVEILYATATGVNNEKLAKQLMENTIVAFLSNAASAKKAASAPATVKAGNGVAVNAAKGAKVQITLAPATAPASAPAATTAPDATAATTAPAEFKAQTLEEANQKFAKATKALVLAIDKENKIAKYGIFSKKDGAWGEPEVKSLTWSDNFVGKGAWANQIAAVKAAGVEAEEGMVCNRAASKTGFVFVADTVENGKRANGEILYKHTDMYSLAQKVFDAAPEATPVTAAPEATPVTAASAKSRRVLATQISKAAEAAGITDLNVIKNIKKEVIAAGGTDEAIASIVKKYAAEAK